MKSFRKELWLKTRERRDLINITPQVETCLKESGIREGILLCNAMHITASVFINDRLGKYHIDTFTEQEITSSAVGGVLQDFNGDGHVDLLTLAALGTPNGLYLSQTSRKPRRSTQFDDVIESASTFGGIIESRVLDMDLLEWPNDWAARPGPPPVTSLCRS